MVFTKNQIKRLLVDRYILRYKKHRNINPVKFEHIEPLQCIQIDSLRIVEKSQDLVLHNRFDKYSLVMLDKIAYENRQLIEAQFNALCYVPPGEYRYHLRKHKLIGDRYKSVFDNLDRENKIVMAEIRKQGALPAKYFKGGDKFKWGFSMSLKKTTAALESLWYSGKLLTDYRDKGNRYYNLPERVLPEGTNMKLPPLKEYHNFMIGKHFKTYIVADPRHHRFLSMRMPAAEKRKLLEPYLKKGEIVELEIEGAKSGYFISKENYKILQNAHKIKPDARVRFMAPLDNMLFNRDLIKDIFDFDYTWEVYVPKAKRKYGYYIMPILYKFDFIGRVDPRADRKKSTLIFHLIQIEDSVKISKTMVTEIARAARRLARFAGLDHIVIKKTVPSSLKAQIEKAL